jgi:hypothetical protein
VAIFFRSKQRDPDAVDATARITAWTREILALGEDDVVSVSEIACGEPGCGGLETVILIMRKGEKTRGAKVKMGLAFITRADVEAALAELSP